METRPSPPAERVKKTIASFGATGNTLAGLASIVGGVGGGVYVFWQWGTTHMLGPLVAILTAFAAFVCVRVALDPEMGPRAMAHLKSKLGLSASETPTLEDRDRGTLAFSPHQPDPTTADQLAMAWLWQNQKPNFSSRLETARAKRDELEALYQHAVRGEIISPTTLRQLGFEFSTALQEADSIYRNCFEKPSNMSLTNPYRAGTLPLEGMSKLPEDVQPIFRQFRERVQSLEAHGQEMLETFDHAIQGAQSAVSGAAHEAIRKINQKREQ